MSGEKPAPTAAEISKARDFLDDRYLDNVLSLEFPRTVDHIRTLLAALDAAEARVKALAKVVELARQFREKTEYCFSAEEVTIDDEDERDALAMRLDEAIEEVSR